jgi:hypothetical protein
MTRERKDMTVRVVSLHSREASEPPVPPPSAAGRLRLVRELSKAQENRDFRDVVAELVRADARFLIVGAHALGLFGVPRATSDLDIFVDRSPENAERVWTALVAFGAPLTTLGIAQSDLSREAMVAQFGAPPHRIDVMTGISGVSFEEAWAGRVEEDFEGVRAPFIGREAFIRNKRSSGRLKDLGDLESLGEL